MGKYLSKIISGDKYGTTYLIYRNKRIATMYYNRFLEISECPDGWAMHHIIKFMNRNGIDDCVDIDKMILDKVLYDQWNHCYTTVLSNPLHKKEEV